jgi:hypothetical protein
MELIILREGQKTGGLKSTSSGKVGNLWPDIGEISDKSAERIIFAETLFSFKREPNYGFEEICFFTPFCLWRNSGQKPESSTHSRKLQGQFFAGQFPH